MIQGVIVGHRDIGASILRALESISGPVRDICFCSNEGLSTRELAAKIQECTGRNDVPSIIFVDVFGGSCWHAVKMAQTPNSHIITGLNLPMLLAFISKRDTVPFEELPSVLASDGIRGITME
ncbi:PTS sugar transporter subunit IIA [Candidatus Latescibacterota bacterium]